MLIRPETLASNTDQFRDFCNDITYERLDDPTLYHSWDPIKEPMAPIIDSFARSSLKVKKKVKPPTEQKMDARPISGQSKRSTGSKAKSNVTKGGTEGKGTPVPETVQEVTAVQLTEDFTGGRDQNANPEVENLRKQKERELKRRREELERIKSKQMEEEEQKKKMEKLKAELKSKDFT